MKSENVSEAKFLHAGPLVLDRRLNGPVVRSPFVFQKHALDSELSAPLENVQYDPNQNEIVNIGSNVEVYAEGETPSEAGVKAMVFEFLDTSFSKK
ncbi:hypothetical protein KIN20_009400 [Parelaphostrongylus tenuis]|uniref:Uncharacterized protein n=1 Tax=Parelaphostrongylus tenuis TaxID=148309 RepID=A0AAD5QL82_PARTN|nr:hypothetical protein KIN20_009400 [Parelaphostrongylus tenuis]